MKGIWKKHPKIKAFDFDESVFLFWLSFEKLNQQQQNNMRNCVCFLSTITTKILLLVVYYYYLDGAFVVLLICYSFEQQQ